MSRVALTLFVLSVALASVGAVAVAPAVPAEAASHRFLTLPFHDVSAKRIQEGFMWTGCCHVPVHGGIDYIQGTLDRSVTWRSFPVYAAASGMACSQVYSSQKGCISGVGNRVLIKTKVAGKVYYHYYGHFRAIVSSIPRGGAKVHVNRGDLLGWSGHSGDPCCVIHLHFQLMTADWKSIDPYGLYSTRSNYPNPAGTNGKHTGSSSYWLSDPPRAPARGATSSSATSSSATSSSVAENSVADRATASVARRPTLVLSA